MIFQYFTYTNAKGCKFDLAIKRSKVNLVSSFETNLVDPEPPMLYIIVQPQSFLGSNFQFPFDRMLHMKLEENWPREF